MVGTIKRWLGIEALERENLTLAKALKAAHRRIAEVREEAKSEDSRIREETIPGIGNHEERIVSLEQRLTAEAEKPKIIAKPAAPKRVNWRQAREALEKANDVVEEE
jgi:hypothetical protein